MKRTHSDLTFTQEFQGEPKTPGYSFVTEAPTSSLVAPPTSSPILPTNPPTLAPVLPTSSPSVSQAPTFTSAPSSLDDSNILNFGSMEERSVNLTEDPTGDRVVKSNWLSKCNVRTDTVEPYEGNRSLYMEGLRRCFVMRPIGPACGTQRIREAILPGETILISLWVKLSEANRVFQIYTGHYHKEKGRRNWAMPNDDSYIVSRTIIPEANTWTKVTAIHKVGPDWS